MRISLRRISASITLPAALAGAVALAAPGHAATAASSVPIRTQHVADKNIVFPQITWDLAASADNFSPGGAYLNMLNELQQLAVATAHARRVGPILDANNGRDYVVILDNKRVDHFADIVITNSDAPGTPALHVVVRLSDFYVVRFYGVSPNPKIPPTVINLAPGIPGASDTDDNHWIGKEGYDALSRVAGTPLSSVQLSQASFDNTRQILTRNTVATDSTARQMLQMILTIAEGARFRPIANRIATALNSGGATSLSGYQVDLIHRWAGVSHVFVGRYNQTDASASTSVGGYRIDDLRVATYLLTVALNDGPNPNPKDEL